MSLPATDLLGIYVTFVFDPEAPRERSGLTEASNSFSTCHAASRRATSSPAWGVTASCHRQAFAYCVRRRCGDKKMGMKTDERACHVLDPRSAPVETHPLDTEQVRVAFGGATARVENNLVHNAVTRHQASAVRIQMIGDSRYFAVIVPVLADGRVVLIGRYRYAIDRWSIEFPRFELPPEDEGWKVAAEHDLFQTSGLEPGQMRPLGVIQIDPAWIATVVVVILAEGCTPRVASATSAAHLVVGSIALSPEELDYMIREGEITCGVTLSALCLYRASRQ